MAFLQTAGETDKFAAVAQDGPAVVAGGTHDGNTTSLSMLRFTGSGAPDPTFHAGTPFTIAAPGRLMNVIVQADHGVLIVDDAAPTATFFVARITAAGQLDTTFGTQGMVQATPGIALSAALTEGGRQLLVVGAAEPPPQTTHARIARYWLR